MNGLPKQALIVINATEIKRPIDFLQGFLTVLCNLEQPATITEERCVERLTGRWGSGEAGYLYESQWSAETSAIPESCRLSTSGVPDLDLEWRFENPHWTHWLSEDAGVENQHLLVHFGSEDMRNAFQQYFFDKMGKEPIFAEQSQAPDADKLRR